MGDISTNINLMEIFEERRPTGRPWLIWKESIIIDFVLLE
jgi:hypothetical protein